MSVAGLALCGPGQAAGVDLARIETAAASVGFAAALDANGNADLWGLGDPYPMVF